MKTYLPWLAALPLLAHAECEMTRFQRVQASPHVVAYEAAEGSTAVVNGNMVAIMGRDAVLLVDTGQFPSITRRMIADIRAHTSAPVKYVVNTHWHGDHLLGNDAVKQVFPAVKFIAHSHTIEQGRKYYENYPAGEPAELERAAQDMRKELLTATRDDAKTWIAKTLECVEAIAPEVPATHYVAPDTPMDTEMKIDLGGVTAVVKHIGTGNTPGDLVVWVPEDRLVASGDMVVAPTPYAGGSDLAPWVKTITKLRAMKAAVIVPGHGAVMRDYKYVDDLEKLLITTQSQLVAMKAAGVEKKDAAEKLETSNFRKLYVTTAMRREAFRQFFVLSAIQKIWPKTPPAR
ncbi:MAG: MBL fold metallo-hydrolase [Usitatibacter sp.]